MSKERRSRYRTHTGSTTAVILAEKGLSSADLAAGLGFSPAYVSQVLTGKQRPSAAWVEMVADVLKLDAGKRRDLHYAAALDHGFKLDLSQP